MRPETFIPAQVLCRAIDLEMRADFILELPTLILEMLKLDLMPSLNAEYVRDVDGSIFLPRSEISGLRLPLRQSIIGIAFRVPIRSTPIWRLLRSTEVKKSKGNNWPPAKRSAKRRSIVRSAVLQNPLEVEASIRGCPAEQRERLRGQWILNGTISSLMFDDLKANMPNDLSSHLTAITTPSGAAYAFITCQKGVRQHRFVLPLYEPKVMEFFAAVSRQPLNLYLGSVKGGDEGFIYDCDFSHDELMPVLDIINSVSHENRDNFISELPQFLVDIVNPEFVPSLTTTDVVRNVDVSMLMPMRALQGRVYEHCLEAA